MAATARAHWYGGGAAGREELYCNQLTSLGLTKPMFGTEQPMPGAHSNGTELVLVLNYFGTE